MTCDIRNEKAQPASPTILKQIIMIFFPKKSTLEYASLLEERCAQGALHPPKRMAGKFEERFARGKKKSRLSCGVKPTHLTKKGAASTAFGFRRRLKTSTVAGSPSPKAMVDMIVDNPPQGRRARMAGQEPTVDIGGVIIVSSRS